MNANDNINVPTSSLQREKAELGAITLFYGGPTLGLNAVTTPISLPFSSPDFTARKMIFAWLGPFVIEREALGLAVASTYGDVQAAREIAL